MGRHGAAGSMARAAPARATAARPSAPLPHPTTAMQASPTGWLAGACRRSNGAARTQAKAAHQLTEVAPERCKHLGMRGIAWALAHCAIFRCLRMRGASSLRMLGAVGVLAHVAIFRCLQVVLGMLQIAIAAVHELSMAGCRAGTRMGVCHLPVHSRAYSVGCF